MKSSLRIETAAFTGHRMLPPDPSSLLMATECAVVSLIERGVRFFGAGGALGFDSAAARLILTLRDTRFPQIKLIQVLPFRGMDAKWTSEQQQELHDINRQADRVVWLAEQYTGNHLYHARNRHLVDHAAYLIAFCRDTNGRSGTAACYRYAVNQGREIILVRA